MAYNSLISRTDAAALIPEEVSREIFAGVTNESSVLRYGRRLPNMSRNQQRMAVLSGLPTAYFVNGDTGLKQTSDVAWTNKYIDAEELAVIVPIPESVLDDTDYDIWSQIKPLIVEAFGKAFDAAVFYGTSAPSSWPTNLISGSSSASNTVSLAAFADYYDAILGEGGLFSKVEEDGYAVKASVAAMTVQAGLRGTRDANGQPIFMQNMQAPEQFTLAGRPVYFPMNGAISSASSYIIAGDWSQLVYSIRQDITYKVLTESVIQDNAGTIVYNLAQQDMVALRAVMRLGWELPNPINRMQATEASRYPFAVLTA